MLTKLGVFRISAKKQIMPKSNSWLMKNSTIYFCLISSFRKFEFCLPRQIFFQPSPGMVNWFLFFLWAFLFCFGEDFFQLFFLVWCKDKKKWGYCKNIYFLLVITKICLCGSWTLNLGEFNWEGFFNLINCREGSFVFFNFVRKVK